MADLIYKEESYKIIGACFEVYNYKGCGFTEPTYQECLEIELRLQNIPFVPQPEIKQEYKKITLKHHFAPDFICFDKIILEIKAVENLAEEHISQTINYLNATNYKLAWLVNFGKPNGLQRKRLVNENGKTKSIKEEIQNWNFNPENQ